MKFLSVLTLAAALVPALVSEQAHALTMRECAAKFDAAKKAGNTMKWLDFRKAECGPDASPTSAASPAARPTSPPARALAPSSAVFPTRVDSKYAKETPARARLRTCADQFRANKEKDGNGGLKWIEKGGGYWSQCNTKLKAGAA